MVGQEYKEVTSKLDPISTTGISNPTHLIKAALVSDKTLDLTPYPTEIHHPPDIPISYSRDLVRKQLDIEPSNYFSLLANIQPLDHDNQPDSPIQGPTQIPINSPLLISRPKRKESPLDLNLQNKNKNKNKKTQNNLWPFTHI
jgi:hypothetical protein